MSAIMLYILYLSLWRFIVVLCGALSIYLGYRLFVIGYSQGGSHMKGAFGGVSVAFRNFAPGTAFALFGAILIAVMVAVSPAEVNLSLQPHALTASPIAADQSEMELSSGGGSLILRGE
jgi:hypothetical protein